MSRSTPYAYAPALCAREDVRNAARRAALGPLLREPGDAARYVSLLRPADLAQPSTLIEM